MEQKFDVVPEAEIRLAGRRVERGHVKNDWGVLLQWEVRRDGKVVATAPARAETAFDLPAEPGKYEVVLQTWKYVDYKKNPAGEFVNSRFIDISNKLTFSV